MGLKTPHRPRLSKDEWELVLNYRRQNGGETEYQQRTFDATAECTAADHVKTLDELLDACDVDLELWDVVKHRISKSDMTNKFGVRYQNFHVKAELSKKIDIEDFYGFKQDLIDELKKFSPKFEKIDYPKKTKKSGRMVEVLVFDLHHGQICYRDETGEHWDLFTSEEHFKEAVTRLVTEAVADGVDQWLFPIGNDFFNTNSHFPSPQTLRGTPQIDEYQWQKTFKQGRQMIFWAIDFMAQYAPVHVLRVPGNHDDEKSFFLGDVVEVRYENHPQVTVDNGPSTRKFYRWGNTLLGFTHGTSRNETIPRLHFAIAHHPEWANTKFREWHLGDKHHSKKTNFIQEEDEQGVNVRWMRSLVATDRYHFDKAYKHQIRGAEAIAWTLDRGMDREYKYNIVPDHIM